MKQETNEEFSTEALMLEVKQLKKELKKAQREIKRLENENSIYLQLNEKALQIREHNEEEQARQQQYINLILGSSPMIFLLVDQELRSLMATESFYKKSSFTKAQIHAGVYICDLFCGLLDEAARENMAEKVRQSMQKRMEYHYVERMGLEGNGRERIYDVEIKPAVSTKGELIGAVLVFSNITELVRAREAAESADRAKSNFLANMSHEIRTPMNAICGMSEFIIRDTVDAAARENAQQIKNAASSLLSIINDILDFSKIEAGRMEILDAPYQLHSVLNDVMTMMNIRLEKKPVKLRLEIEPKLPSRLVGDELRIKQILINILNNAVKFTDKGSITLRMWQEPVKEGQAEGGQNQRIRIFYQVEDSGRGIKPEDLKKLFCSFSQVDTKRNRGVEGTGLGLAISQRLAEAMGGRIEVSSRYGSGTTFTWSVVNEVEDSVPIGEIPRSGAADEGTVFQNGFIAPKASVLVVDDNLVNLKVAEGILKPYQMQVTLAESGKEAVLLAEAKHYDIIFMDHMMPEMDGVEALKEIRRLPGQENSVIIALTANAISGMREMYLEEGFQDYLAKPIEMSKMQEILKKHLSQNLLEKCEKRKSAENGCWKRSEVLHQVYLEGRKKLELLPKLIQETDFRAYMIEVHALKSVAAAIGKMELSQMAKEHEMAAKAGDRKYIYEHFPELFDSYRTLVEQLAEAFEEKPPDEEPLLLEEIPPEKWKCFLQKLKEAVEDFDLDAMEEITKELRRHKMKDDQRKAVQEFCDAAQLFDYDVAESILCKMEDCSE